MGCGCNGSKKEYEHIAKDGTITVVGTQTEAIAKTRREGGSWRVRNK